VAPALRCGIVIQEILLQRELAARQQVEAALSAYVQQLAILTVCLQAWGVP
jgi:hypothetical protein